MHIIPEYEQGLVFTIGISGSMMFSFVLSFLCSDCRFKHHGQRHGSFDAEERVSEWFRRVHLPGWKLHRSLPSFCLAHRGRWCVPFSFYPLQIDTDTGGHDLLPDPNRALGVLPQMPRPLCCPLRRTWRSSSTALAFSSWWSSRPQQSSADSAARQRRVTLAARSLSKSWRRASL